MSVADIVLSPFTGIAWVLSLPIRTFASITSWVRRRKYDPEKDICPGCGFRGDSGTAGKTCRIQTREVHSAEKLALWHECYRCYAEYWTNTFIPAAKWYRKPIRLESEI